MAYLVDIIVPGVHGSLAPRVVVLVADIARIISSDSTDKDKGCSHPEGAIPAARQRLSAAVE